MSLIETPDVATLGTDANAYRLELVRTLSHCFKLNLEKNPELKSQVNAITLERFTREMQTASLRQLEDKLEALRVQNPGLVAEAMQRAGHKISQDKDGNVVIGDGTPQFGSYVDFGAFTQ